MSRAALYVGDALEVLRTLPDESVQCCVTSPPYWGLRDYSTPGQLGLEADPREYVSTIVEVFAEVRRVLAGDGTLWLNIGDCYAAIGAGRVGDHPGGGEQDSRWAGRAPKGATSTAGFRGKNSKHDLAKGNIGPMTQPNRMPIEGLKPKDLVMMPARVALALQADGWWLRSDIIWSKPNPMPESVTDRPTKAHEHVFLLTKNARYFYDATAIAEPLTTDPAERYPERARITGRGTQGAAAVRGNDRDKSGRFPLMRRPQYRRAVEIANEAGLTDAHIEAIRATGIADAGKSLVTTTGAGRNTDQVKRLAAEAKEVLGGYYREFLLSPTRNARSVWTIATKPYSGAHYATMPPELASRCIKAGSKPTDTVLDPFGGSGTTASVATGHGRDAIHIDLNPDLSLAIDRIGSLLVDVKGVMP